MAERIPVKRACAGRVGCACIPSCASRGEAKEASRENSKALRTHIYRLLGPKTIQYKAFGLF